MATPRLLNDVSHQTQVTSLVHGVLPSHFIEVVRDTGGLITRRTVWSDSGKTRKIRESVITRSSNLISQVVKTQYDLTGAVVETHTLAVARDGSSRVSTVTTTKT